MLTLESLTASQSSNRCALGDDISSGRHDADNRPTTVIPVISRSATAAAYVLHGSTAVGLGTSRNSASSVANCSMGRRAPAPASWKWRTMGFLRTESFDSYLRHGRASGDAPRFSDALSSSVLYTISLARACEAYVLSLCNIRSGNKLDAATRQPMWRDLGSSCSSSAGNRPRGNADSTNTAAAVSRTPAAGAYWSRSRRRRTPIPARAIRSPASDVIRGPSSYDPCSTKCPHQRVPTFGYRCHGRRHLDME